MIIYNLAMIDDYLKIIMTTKSYLALMGLLMFHHH